jgi:hypothetical protein
MTKIEETTQRYPRKTQFKTKHHNYAKAFLQNECSTPALPAFIRSASSNIWNQLMFLLSTTLHILPVKEDGRFLHSFSSLSDLMLPFLRQQACPVYEKRAHHAHNLSRRFDSFVLKANSISRTPNSPTHSSQTHGVHYRPLRQNFLNPEPKLVH